jgi:uncharacterized protein YjeT (DUF2065 family)
MDYFLCVLGMVFIIEGLPYFLFPDKLKTYMTKINKLPGTTLRFIGISIMLVGLALLYFGRN